MVRGQRRAIFLSVLLAPLLAVPAGLAAAERCHYATMKTWPAYQSCRSEARAGMDAATKAWADSRSGWLEQLSAAREKGKSCQAIHDRVMAEVRACQAAARKDAETDRSEKERRRRQDQLAEQARRELQERTMAGVGKYAPEFLKAYRAGKLADATRRLAGNRKDAANTLESIDTALRSMRSLMPAPPGGGAWSLSGDLLRVSLQEYRNTVVDALASFEEALARLERENADYYDSINRDVRAFRELQERWRGQMARQAAPRHAPAPRREAPAQSTCPPGWTVDYYYGTACTCRGTSTMSIASAWANYREYGACR